jgi:peptidoglycan/LPS O-acetylase OafA/YrhL
MSSTERGLYIPSLDGLRCVAIIPVFLSHALMTVQVPNFIPGNFGVTLFFFLSGYLITTLLRLEMERTGTVSFRLFYVRRMLRIFPTSYLVLGLAALHGMYVGVSDPLWLLGQMLHLTNFQVIAGGWDAPIAPHTSIYWSLAVEEHFYLVFPLFFVALARLDSRAHRAGLLLGLCAMVFLWRCWLIFVMNVSYDRTYVGTDTRIDSILFGCVLALWGNPALDSTRISEATWKYVLLPLSIVGILLIYAVPARAFRETFGYTVQGLCLFSVFIAAVRYPDWGPMRALNLPWVRWIGALSFSIYLIHPSILELTQAMVGSSLPILVPTAIALTVVLSAAMYYGVELPVRRMRKALRVFAHADRPTSRS